MPTSAKEFLDLRGLADLSLGWPLDKPAPQVHYPSSRTVPTLAELLEDYAAASRPSVPEQGQAWVKVSERLPNQEKCCLWCKVPICEPPVIGAIDDGDFDYAEYFTHWMALPNEFFPDPRNAALAVSRSEVATAQDDKCVIRRAQALATDIIESSLVHSDLTEWLLAYRKSEIYRAGAPAAGSTERVLNAIVYYFDTKLGISYKATISDLVVERAELLNVIARALAQTDTDVPKEKL